MLQTGAVTEVQMISGPRVLGLGFGVEGWGLGIRVWGLGFRVWGLGRCESVWVLLRS